MVERLVDPPHLGDHLRVRGHLAVHLVPRVARLRHRPRTEPALLARPCSIPAGSTCCPTPARWASGWCWPPSPGSGAGGHPQRGAHPQPGALRPGHVRAAAPVGGVVAGRLRRRPPLRLLAAVPHRPHRRPPDGGDGGGPAPGGALPRRAAGPPAAPAGPDRGGAGAAGRRAVLRRHRGPGHHGHRGGHRAGPGGRLRLPPPGHRHPGPPVRRPRAGGRGGHRRRAAGLPGRLRPGRTGPLLRRDLAPHHHRVRRHLVEGGAATHRPLGVVHQPDPPGGRLPGPHPVRPVPGHRPGGGGPGWAAPLAWRPAPLAVRGGDPPHPPPRPGPGEPLLGALEGHGPHPAGPEHRAQPLHADRLPVVGRHGGGDRRPHPDGGPHPRRTRPGDLGPG